MAKVIKQAGKTGVVLMLPVLIFGVVFYVSNRLTLAQTAGEVATVVESAPIRDPFESARDGVIADIKAGESLEAAAGFESFAAGFSADERFVGAVVDIADTYRKEGSRELANGLYQYVLETYPDNENVFWAEVGLVLSDVSTCAKSCLQDSLGALYEHYAGDPRLAAASCYIADEFRRGGKYAQARKYYRYVIEQHPEAEHALWSKMGCAIADIAAGKFRRANDMVAILFADHFGDERVANAACRIADEYRKKGKFREARDIYQYVLADWPEAEHAIWSRMGSVISDISLDNDPNAAHGVRRLLADFSSDSRTANAIRQIADTYQKSGKYQEACDLHEYVVSNWPSAEHAIWCQKGLAVTEVFYTADPNTFIALDRLLTDFADHPTLPQAAFFTAEAYRDNALSSLIAGNLAEAQRQYARAATAWEQVIQRTPESVYTPESYYLLAECYYNPAAYLHAIDCYRLIVDTWPDWKLAWSAQFQVGYKYNQLKKAGFIDPATADGQTQVAYERLLERYPDCPAVKAATNWLNSHSN